MLGRSHTSVSLFLLPFCSGMFLSFLFSALELILSIKNKQTKKIHTHFFSFPTSNLFIFNWRKTASQYCIDLCLDQHESAISIHASPPSLTSLPYLPTPLGCYKSPSLSSLCHITNFHWLSILHMVVYMLPCYSLLLSHPLLSPYCACP